MDKQTDTALCSPSAPLKGGIIFLVDKQTDKALCSILTPLKWWILIMDKKIDQLYVFPQHPLKGR
jgi:hypothetical protein